MTRSRIVRWLQWVLMAIAAFGLGYLFLIMIQPYRQQLILAEKRGRLIDGATGIGLPDVTVVINYRSTFFTPFRTSSSCIHQKIVRTDADGYYVIPDASSDVDVTDDLLWRALPGFSQSFGWSLLYYKDGYKRKDDMERFLRALNEGRDPPIVFRSGIYEKKDGAYQIPTVQLARADLNATPLMADAYAVYTRYVSTDMWCVLGEERQSSEIKQIQNAIKSSMRRTICELPPEKELTDVAKKFSFTDCASTLGIRQIKAKKGQQARITAGDMCQSYRYVPNEHECQGASAERPHLKVVNKMEIPENGQ